ncbi:hypothetical protein [Streptomyces sp. NPDC020141]|uniref:hypothetical protein n=1 Tax=Streptomyces sp. NPDC020141 TaxID=3365065 RepID=UPI0037BDDC53
MTTGRTQNTTETPRGRRQPGLGDQPVTPETWLAGSHSDPDAVRREWAETAYAMVPAGILFDAVRIHAELVHAVAGAGDHDTVSACLTETLAGPVLCRTELCYYALVPAGTSESWQCGLARCLGRGAWIGVPRPGESDPYRLHWCAPMEEPGRLCPPDAVAALIERGHELLTPQPTEFRRPAR